jgi:hypothetical protein
MTTMALRADTIYATFDRFVCAEPRCAGSTARASGRDIDGTKLRAVDAADVREWDSYGLGPLRCECGHLTATSVIGPGGAVIAQVAQ